MVSKERLSYVGLDGFRAPVVPKAPRSLRRNSRKKSLADSKICPFELLAAVAGKLLQENECSVSSIPKEGVKQESLEVKLNPLRLDYPDHGCCAESEFVSEPSNLELKIEPPLKDLPEFDSVPGLEHASIITTSDFFKEINTNVKLEASNGKNAMIGDSSDIKMDTFGAEVQTDATERQSEDLTAVKSWHRNNVKIGIRDDDENSFSFNHHITKMRAFRLQSRAGYRRIRKILTTTKHWKSAPKLNDYEPSNPTSLGVKSFDHNRKSIYMRKHCQARPRLREGSCSIIAQNLIMFRRQAVKVYLIYLKEVDLFSGDNETHVSNVCTNNVKGKNVEDDYPHESLKRNLVEIYDVEENVAHSVTKPRSSSSDGEDGCAKYNMITSKVEK